VINALIGGVREWQHPTPKIYRIQPESFLHEIKNFPAVELSFEMIYYSIISLQDWCFSSKSSNAEKGKVIKNNSKQLGFHLN
jgi:hypothetical protein